VSDCCLMPTQSIFSYIMLYDMMMTIMKVCQSLSLLVTQMNHCSQAICISEFIKKSCYYFNCIYDNDVMCLVYLSYWIGRLQTRTVSSYIVYDTVQ